MKKKDNGSLLLIYFKAITKNMLHLNMWFIMTGILALAFSSIVTFLVGIAIFASFLIHEIDWQHFHVPHNFDVIICEILEINLIAVILFICAIGLYLLFWKDIRVPEWLSINNINQLKEKLVGILITVMGVTFLEHILEWHDPKGTLMFGGAIALIITALVFYTKIMILEEEHEKRDEHHR